MKFFFPDSQDQVDPSFDFIIEERDAIPEKISSGQLKEQRALANRELWLGADPKQLGRLFLEPVVMIRGELFHRGPCLSLMTNVLPFVSADRASFWRCGGRAELGPALHTDEI